MSENNPFDSEELNRQVEKIKAAKIQRDQQKAAKAEHERIRAEEIAKRADQDSDPEISTSIQSMISGLRAIAKPVTPEQERQRAWDDFIVPRLENAAIDPRFFYEVEDWGNRYQQKAFDLCQGLFGKEQGAIVALVGNRGAGKTTIASQIVVQRAWEDHGRISNPALTGQVWRYTPYRKFIDLVSTYKALYGDFGAIDVAALQERRAGYCASELAIIDEVGDCEDMRLGARILTDMLDRFYARMHDVLLISNQTKDAFEKSVSDSVLSRIHEHGLILECKWESWRSPKLKHLAKHA